MRARRPLLLFAAVLAGCPSAPSGKDSPDAGRAAALRVPIPAGWQANAREGVLEVGRDGDVVLLIRRERLGKGPRLPTSDELRAAFLAGAGTDEAKVLQSEENAAMSFVALELGGGPTPGYAFVGVKRLGEDWFLCRSAPGKNAEALQVAVAACRGLEWK